MRAEERETTVTATDADDLVRIWTAQRRHVGRLRRNPAFTEVRSGTIDGAEWAEFTIPNDQWNPASGAKRKAREYSAEERAALAARLAGSRDQKED